MIVERVELGLDGSLILFRIGASHFLWKMVRRIVGCLAAVGQGTITAEDFRLLLQSPALPSHLKSFSVAANTAPASGLFLERVVYEGDADPDQLVDSSSATGA